MSEPRIPDERARQGDRRRITVRVLLYALPALVLIGIALYAWFFPFE